MAASSVWKDVGSAKWTGFVIVDPLLNTISMKNVFASIYLVEVIPYVLHESSNTDTALFVT
jgi:hypothetical protein